MRKIAPFCRHLPLISQYAGRQSAFEVTGQCALCEKKKKNGMKQVVAHSRQPPGMFRCEGRCSDDYK